jgi:hypothetical protein
MINEMAARTLAMRLTNTTVQRESLYRASDGYVIMRP